MECAFKGLSFPTYESIEKQKEFCAAGWDEQLSHQLPRLPQFETFWNKLISFFKWLKTNKVD